MQFICGFCMVEKDEQICVKWNVSYGNCLYVIATTFDKTNAPNEGSSKLGSAIWPDCLCSWFRKIAA